MDRSQMAEHEWLELYPRRPSSSTPAPSCSPATARLLTHPDDRQGDVDAAWRILRAEISTWQCEKRFLRPDGSVIWAIANLTFLRDEDGNPISWVGQFQDISERKRDEKALQESSRLKSAFLATMSMRSAPRLTVSSD